MTTSRADVATDAADLVRSGRAFEAGKIAFLVTGATTVGELSRFDEWTAFLHWAEQFPGFVPSSLRLSGDWRACAPGELTAFARAWEAFRGGWLVALTNSAALD